MTAAFIRRLTLTNFRSYRAAQLSLDQAGPVVLTGVNGAGKTNRIEAISMLAPGRGLHRATMDELAFSEGDGSWAVSAEIEGMLGLSTLGTGIDPPAGDDASTNRKCRIDRESVGSATAFADHLRVVWLTPAMDPLFNGPASERRRFLDRLVLAVDAQHSSRVSALERSLRSRNRLLEESHSDPHWLDAIEHETAEVAVAVAAARSETVNRLSGALSAARDQAPEFPHAEIALEGWMEKLLSSHSAIEIEDRYRVLLKDNRARDAAATATATSAVSCSIASSQCGSLWASSSSRLRERKERSSAETRLECWASTASTRRSRNRRRSEAGPLNSGSMAGVSHTTRRWSAKAVAEPTLSRSIRHLRVDDESSAAGGSMPVPNVLRPSMPSISAETAQEPSPSVKASSSMVARRKPRPGASSEIASIRLVLPAPLAPVSTTGPARSSPICAA